MLLVYFDRPVPQVEIEAVSQFLFNLLTGDVDKLPTQALVHKFWTYFQYQHKQASGYANCLRRHRLTDAPCYRDVTAYCGSRFGERPPERLEQCRRLVANEENATTMGVGPSITEMFEKYHSCIRSYRRRVDANCTEVLRKTIAGHRLRATKVIRATMNSMGPLLRSLPTLRVIHLVRDPRAVALSRIRFNRSGRGMYTESNWALRSSHGQITLNTEFNNHTCS